jgi:hypothetical protein
LFSEFVAYLGVTAITLAGLGTLGARASPPRIALIALAALGLACALGAYNPLYAPLAAFSPFNLFRVPARWLFLFAFAGAMLAGHGLDTLRERRPGPWLVIAGLILVLLTPLANDLTPPGETGPLGAPTVLDVAGWLLPLLLLTAIFRLRLPEGLRAPGVFTVALIELFLAAQVLPYNHLTAPDAYASVRPATTQLLSSLDSTVPPPRFLSISALRFDPGDLAELHSELDAQLSPDAVYDAIVATKNKEVLSPNLPLAWGVPAVDGYDGGILPLRHYADFTALFTGTPSTDGRLRENITTAPDPRLLSLVNARYLITDKVDDRWVDNVFYDLQFTLTLAAGETASIAHLPAFQATALGMVTDAPSGHVIITFDDGSNSNLPVSSSRTHFAHAARPTSITLVGPLTVRGLSLIDERSGAFHSLTLGGYRLVHSGDVKIYENLNVLPRAFVVPSAVVIRDQAAALTALGDPSFDPTATVLLAANPNASDLQPPSSNLHPASITTYTPDLVRVTATGPGFLVLTDAYYPGWVARVDGASVPILRADLMFRAVALGPGEHQVEFRFEPRSVRVGLWVSGLSWALILTVPVLLLARNKKADA